MRLSAGEAGAPVVVGALVAGQAGDAGGEGGARAQRQPLEASPAGPGGSNTTKPPDVKHKRKNPNWSWSCGGNSMKWKNWSCGRAGGGNMFEGC